MATSDPPSDWQALYDALGGRDKLAERCDVSESTVWRWSRRVATPSKLVRDAINEMCDQHEVPRLFVEEVPNAST